MEKRQANNDQGIIPPPFHPRMSVLAVVALVLAIIPCCPPSSLLGAALGIFAVRRIALSQGRLRGMGVARAAIISGLILSLMSSILLTRYFTHQQELIDEAMVEKIQQVVTGAMTDRSDLVITSWSSRLEPPEAEDILIFGEELLVRYGSLKRFSVVASQRTGTFMAPRMEVAGIFIFENAERHGMAELDFIILPFQTKPAFKVRRLIVEDPKVGDLKLIAPDSDP